jgi:mitochondrial enoyl-[acyl-carrier protein] reductase / trans-2-enoyl-CoA reductase
VDIGLPPYCSEYTTVILLITDSYFYLSALRGHLVIIESMPARCRLIGFGESPPALRVEDFELPRAGPGEVELRMLAAPINPADLNVIQGTYGELPHLPATMGNEGCGVIVACGKGCDLQVGQMVLPLSGGAWAEAMVVPVEAVVLLPAGLDPFQAAMLAVNPATAWLMIHKFQSLMRGSWIVQNAANSGVGRAVIGIARHLGLRTLNVVRRPELVEELLGLGGDVVVTEEIDFRKEVESLCGGARPVLALNAVGGASALNLANALADGGFHVTYGAMGRQPLKIPNGLLIFRDLQFRGFWLRRWRDTTPVPEVHALYQALAELLQAGLFKTPVGPVYPLSQVARAVEEASSRNQSGKVMLDFSCAESPADGRIKP